MRIVGGEWKGLPLEAPEGRKVTRPTTDRVREAMASMVLSAFSLDLSDVHVLDAFAGSGALGIEMLSRGAASASFIDSNRDSVERVKRNLAKLGVEKSHGQVLLADVFSLAEEDRLRGGPFELVMLDPPYAIDAHTVAGLVLTLRAKGALCPHAHVLYERSASSSPLVLQGATMVKQKRFGDTCIDFLKFE